MKIQVILVSNVSKIAIFVQQKINAILVNLYLETKMTIVIVFKAIIIIVLKFVHNVLLIAKAVLLEIHVIFVYKQKETPITIVYVN